jgi:predicted permease
MSIGTDVTLAVRGWKRTPALAAAAVLIVALGVGATATAFAVADATLFRPMPFPDAARLVWVTTRDTRTPSDGLVVSNTRLPQFIDWQRLTSFDALGAWAGERPDIFTVTGSGRPERVAGLRVTAGLLTMLGARPQRGRVFHAGDDAANAPQTVVISDAYWRRRFSARDDVIGTTVTVENVPHTVVGVLTPDFPLSGSLMAGHAVDVYLPLELTPNLDIGGFMAVIGRLASGVSPEQARTELAIQNRATSVGARAWMTNLAQDVTPLAPLTTAGIRTAVLLLFGLVASVWLLACANLANLLLVRATARRRELQVRVALGATLRQIFRQTLAESLVIVAVGGVAALGLATILTETLRSASWLSVPRLSETYIGWTSTLFAFAVCAATAVLFGALPLLHLRRGDALGALRPPASGGPDRRAVVAQRSALAIQVALALVLTTAGGLLVRSITLLLAVDPGFRAEGAIAIRVDPAGRLRVPQRYPFFVEVLTAVRAVPGVQSAALTINLPLDRNMGWDAVLPGRTFDPVTDSAFGRIVSPGYFSAAGIRVVAGRDFDTRDSRNSQAVVAINETLARRLTTLGRDPLAASLVVNGTERHVVAVVADVKHQSLDTASGREVYVPQAQGPVFFQAFDLVIRGERPLALVPAIREAIWRVDANQAIGTPVELRELVDRSLRPRRLLTATLSGFAGVALLLSALGVYGVVGCRVSQRAKELAIRVALGGYGWRVSGAVLWESCAAVGAGLAAGLPLALAAGTALRGYLFNVEAHDAGIVTGASAVVVLAALAAAYVPSRRATRVDPARALRAE